MEVVWKHGKHDRNVQGVTTSPRVQEPCAAWVLKPNVQREITSPRRRQGLTRAGSWEVTQPLEFPWKPPGALEAGRAQLDVEEMEATAGEGTVLSTGD